MKPYTHKFNYESVTIMVSDRGEVVAGGNAYIGLMDGRRTVFFQKNGKSTKRYLSHIVAELYLPKSDLKCVRNKDGNQMNCAADNLEYYRPTSSKKFFAKCNYKYRDYIEEKLNG